MSSSSEELQFSFYTHGGAGVGLNNMASSHPSVVKNMFDFDNEFFPTPWTFEKWNMVFKDERSSYLVGMAHKGASIHGMILLGISDPDVGHLYKILVHPKILRSGVGRKLMHEAEQILKKLHFHSVFLEVEQTNIDALYFYRTLGYKVLVAKKDFYGPMRDAWAMEHLL